MKQLQSEKNAFNSAQYNSEKPGDELKIPNLFKLSISLLWRVQSIGQCTDVGTITYP